MIHGTALQNVPYELLWSQENKVIDTLFRKSLSYLQAHPSFLGSNKLYSSAVMSYLSNSWKTIQSDKITIRGFYSVMINHFGYQVCHKALQLSFTASMAWHCNPFAFKHGREQEGRTVIQQIHLSAFVPFLLHWLPTWLTSRISGTSKKHFE